MRDSVLESGAYVFETGGVGWKWVGGFAQERVGVACAGCERGAGGETRTFAGLRRVGVLSLFG